MVMTLADLRAIKDMRVTLALQLDAWPTQVGYNGHYTPFRAPDGWEWRNTVDTPVLHRSGTPYRIKKSMWESDKKEIRGMSVRSFETEEEEEDRPVDHAPFSNLTTLVDNLIDKPLTNWQARQLSTWDKFIKENPPAFDPVLTVGVRPEVREKQHQIDRIKEVCGTDRSNAIRLYEAGMRLIEQE